MGGRARRLTYSLGRNRFCEHVGRQHKSNRVLVHCDLPRGCWWQVRQTDRETGRQTENERLERESQQPLAI